MQNLPLTLICSFVSFALLLFCSFLVLVLSFFVSQEACYGLSWRTSACTGGPVRDGTCCRSLPLPRLTAIARPPARPPALSLSVCLLGVRVCFVSRPIILPGGERCPGWVQLQEVHVPQTVSYERAGVCVMSS